MKNHWHELEDSGYTLAELLVALALGGIILYLATASYLFSQQYVQRWNNQVKLLNATQLISQLITNELYQADTVLHAEDDQLSTQRRNGEIREISVINGSLAINSRTFNSSAAKVTHLHFNPIIDNQTGEAAGLSQHWIKGIELNVQLAINADTLSAKRLVKLRKPVMWNQLTN